MNKSLNFIIIITTIAIISGILIINNNNNNVSAQNLTTNYSSGISSSTNNETNYQNSQTFTHGIVIELDGVGYYFDGPADGANGTKDAPGHYWWQDSRTHLYGLHYNIGPFG
jgi:hypothetical protein